MIARSSMVNASRLTPSADAALLHDLLPESAVLVLAALVLVVIAVLALWSSDFDGLAVIACLVALAPLLAAASISRLG